MEHKKETFAFIGGGNMGGAIIRGIVSSGTIDPEQIVVCCKDAEPYPAFRKLGVHTADSIAEAIQGACYIFLCVKPNTIREVVSACREAENYSPSVVFVSIAASVPSAHICEAMGFDVPVIRTMPNMPLSIGEGAVAICKNHLVPAKQFERSCRLFSSIATISVMEETQLNAVISVNGSSPAYVYLFIKAMLDGASEQGISKEQALPLILKTVVGSAKMVEKSDVPIEEQIRRVCSPGGTTLASMEVFQDADFVGIVKRAMQACTDRANELSDSLNA